MPEIVANIPDELNASLTRWAEEQQRPLSALVHDILVAAQRTHNRYDPAMSQSTRWIRWCRDGGCGLCHELEPLFGKSKKDEED
jgi:hypothetical protein